MASAAVELNQQRSDSSHAFKPTKPLTQTIDSTPVDNVSDEKTREPAHGKCNHFSIRGYVAEVRKRDPKLCDPFHSYLRHERSKGTSPELPPMMVPKFRWWQCDDCIPGGGSSSKFNKEEASKSADKAVAPMLLIGQTSKADVPSERNIETSASTDSIGNRNCNQSIISADRKGKRKAHVEDELPPQTGRVNGFLKDPSSHGVLPITNDGIGANRSAHEEGLFRSRCIENGNTETLYENGKLDEFRAGPSRDQWNHEADTARGTSLVRMQASVEPKLAEALTNRVGTEVAGIVDGRSTDNRARLVSLPDLNESSADPTDDDNNEVVVTGNTNLCEEDDDYLGEDRRKTPKVRLLSELLGLAENHLDAKVKKKIPSLSSYPGPAAYKSTVSDPPALPPVNDNTKRKRVGSQDEESISLEVKGSSSGAKKSKLLPAEIFESESEDVSTDMISEALVKRRIRSTLDKNPLLETTFKKNKIDHGASCSSWQKIKPKSSHEKSKSSAIRVSADSACSDQVIDLPQKRDASAHLNERNLVPNKKKAKLLHAGKEQNSLIHCKNHAPRECAVARKDKEDVQTGAVHVQNEPSRDRSTEKGSYPFPDNYMVARNDLTRIPPAKDVFHHLPSSAEPMLFDEGVMRKFAENKSLPFKISSTVPFPGSRSEGHREKITGTKSNSKGKQVRIPEADQEGSVSQHTLMQVSNSVMNQRDLTSEVRGRLQDIDINSIPMDDKVPEQVAADDSNDIPMDIVELMAKNQYERNLSNPKDEQNSISFACGKNVSSNGSNSAYGQNMPNFGQSHMLGMQKPLHDDGRNGTIVNGSEDMVSSKNKFLSSFSHLIQNPALTHIRLNPVPARSAAPGQGQEHVSSYSTAGWSPNNWNGQVSLQRYLPSFLQAMDSYNKYRACAPRPSMDARVWPPMVASRMPLGITNPEMISQSSSVLNKGKIHHQGPAILNFNAVNQGKRNINFSNPYNGGHFDSSPAGKQKGTADYPQKSVGSTDLYSNEAIPAMHLLSMMQSAAKGGPPVALPLDGKSELLKRPPVHPYHQQYKQHFNNLESGPQKMGAPSSRQPLLENNGKSSIPENSCHPCYPVASPARPFASSFQNGGGYGRKSGFISPIPLTSRGQRNMDSTHMETPGPDYCPQRSASSDISRKWQSPSVLDKGKGIAGVSSPPSMSLNPFPGTKDFPSYHHGMGRRRDEKISPQKEICMVNRNPSEFNDLRELSRYTIGPEDLRRRGMGREKSSARPRDVKRQDMRMKKPLPTGKERERPRKP